jgi:hypothetical protein
VLSLRMADVGGLLDQPVQAISVDEQFQLYLIL